jgi:hypothetical protein
MRSRGGTRNGRDKEKPHGGQQYGQQPSLYQIEDPAQDSNSEPTEADILLALKTSSDPGHQVLPMRGRHVQSIPQTNVTFLSYDGVNISPLEAPVSIKRNDQMPLMDAASPLGLSRPRRNNKQHLPWLPRRLPLRVILPCPDPADL